MSDGGAQWREFGPFPADDGTIFKGIKVLVTDAGTTNAKKYWTDEGKTSAVSSGVLTDSDADGVVGAFFDGDYRFRVTQFDDSALDNPIDWDKVKVTSDTATMWEGNFGTTYPTAAAKNIFHQFLKVDNATTPATAEIGINMGSAFITLSDSITDDFNAAITAIGGSSATLKVTTALTLTANATVPINIALVITKTGSIVTDGNTLTINGSLDAGPWKIFTATTGEVVFGQLVEAIYPDWWTLNATPGTTDMSTAIQSAFDSLPTDHGGLIQFLDAIYGLGTKVLYTATSGWTVRGKRSRDSTVGTIIKALAAIDMFEHQVVGGGSSAAFANHFIYEDINIWGNSTATTGVGAGGNVDDGNCSKLRFNEVKFESINGTGLRLTNATGSVSDMSINHCIFENGNASATNVCIDMGLAVDIFETTIASGTGIGLLARAGTSGKVFGGVFSGNLYDIKLTGGTVGRYAFFGSTHENSVVTTGSILSNDFGTPTATSPINFDGCKLHTLGTNLFDTTDCGVGGNEFYLHISGGVLGAASGTGMLVGASTIVDMQASFENDLTWTVTAGGAVSSTLNWPSSRAYLNAAQQTTDATFERVLYDTIDWNYGARLDVVTNKGRFTPVEKGIYHVDAQVNFTPVAGKGDGELYQLSIDLSGTDIKTSVVRGSTDNEVISLNVSGDIAITSAAQYIEIQFWHNDGAGASRPTINASNNATNVNFRRVGFHV